MPNRNVSKRKLDIQINACLSPRRAFWQRVKLIAGWVVLGGTGIGIFFIPWFTRWMANSESGPTLAGLKNSGIISYDQALALSLVQINNLNAFNELIAEGLLAEGLLLQLLGLPNELIGRQIANIDESIAEGLLAEGLLLQLLGLPNELTGRQIANIKEHLVLIRMGVLTIQQLLAFSDVQLHNLSAYDQMVEALSPYPLADFLALRFPLTETQKSTLQNGKIKPLIIRHNLLSFEDALTLSEIQANNLELLSPFLTRPDAPLYGKLSSQELLPLIQGVTKEQIQRLVYKSIQALLAEGILSVGQVLGPNSFTPAQVSMMTFPQIKQGLRNGSITPEQMLKWNTQQWANVESLSPWSEDAIHKGILTFEQLLNLTETQNLILSNYRIRRLIENQIVTGVTLSRALALTVTQANTITSDFHFNQLFNGRVKLGILILMISRTFRYGQVLRCHALPETQKELLDSNYQRILTGEVTIAGLGINLDEPPASVVVINGAQSTHTASIHASASKSALKLFTRYQSNITGEKLNEVIADIRKWAEALPDDPIGTPPLYAAAKDAISRLTTPSYTFTDPRSDISTKQLLAVCWLALHDESQRLPSVTLDDATIKFVQALRDTERGYNLNTKFIDDGFSALPICCAGTFNKLVEGVQTVCSDVSLCFITSETASWKLAKTIQGEAIRFLAALYDNVSTLLQLKERLEMTRLLKEDGLGTVIEGTTLFGHICPIVTSKMYNEFQELYTGPEDPKFTELVDAGVDLDLEPTEVRKALVGSAGYRLFDHRSYTKNFFPSKDAAIRHGQEKELNEIGTLLQGVL